MTDTPDPRIEAVAKLLFTGPLCRQRIEDWGKNAPDFFYDLMCLSVAKEVLLNADTNSDWGVQGAVHRQTRYNAFIARLRKATRNVDIDTAKLLVEAANVIEDISSNWEPKRGVAGTVVDLDGLPDRAVVRDRTGAVYEKQIIGDHTYWLDPGREMPSFSSLIELPAQILWAREVESIQMEEL